MIVKCNCKSNERNSINQISENRNGQSGFCKEYVGGDQTEFTPTRDSIDATRLSYNYWSLAFSAVHACSDSIACAKWWHIMGFPFFTCQCPPMCHNTMNDLWLMADTAYKFPCKRWSAYSLSRDFSLQEVKHPISLFLTSVSLFLLVVFICRSRTTALPFANDSAVVREEQRCSSRTANNFAL